MEKNFWRLDDKSLFRVAYAYVDSCNYVADELFRQEKIWVRYNGEMVREGYRYCVVFCKVLKKDAGRFEETLMRLKNKLLLQGDAGYLEACEEINELLVEA